MTEKHYGGAAGFGLKDSKPSNANKEMPSKPIKKDDKKDKIKEEKTEPSGFSENIEGKEEIIKAGKIASQVRQFALEIVKKDALLLEIAEGIEQKIVELGGKPAFPVNLSTNEVAAHDTPAYNDVRKAYGLLKVDFGVSINGYIADTAFTVDLEDKEINKKLIKTANDCLMAALKIVGHDTSLGTLGAEVEKIAKKEGFLTIRNLSGHSIEQWNLHSGFTIPNYDTKQIQTFETGVFAIEPFVTNGTGTVRDGKLSGIYQVQKEGAIRDNFAREVMNYILEEYSTLPFCSRWIHKKFGTRGLLALRQIESAGVFHHYSQLVENGLGLVAQAEHTVIITKDWVIATTL